MRNYRVSMGGLAMLVVAGVLAGCGSSTPAEATLPIGFSQRSDVPYIIGRIVRRTTENGQTRLLVRARDGSSSRVPEAVVTVAPATLMKWSDGDAATRADLRVGLGVMVWVSGAELRSLPPQVAADAVLLVR
jgi:hypothetical protein